MRRLQRQLFFLCLALMPTLAVGSYHHDNARSELALPYPGHAAKPFPADSKLLLAEHEEEQDREGRDGHKRGKRWEQLTPEQRRKIEKRREKYKSLPPEEQERIRKARQQYQKLPPEKRRELRDKYRKSKRRRDER